MTSVLGTILDPAADKALVGTLVVTLTMQGLIPREFLTREEALVLMSKLVPLATIIVGRDMLLSLSAFYIRYTSLPHPVSYITLPWRPSTQPPRENVPALLGLFNTIGRSASYNDQQSEHDTPTSPSGFYDDKSSLTWRNCRLWALPQRFAVSHVQHRMQGQS